MSIRILLLLTLLSISAVSAAATDETRQNSDNWSSAMKQLAKAVDQLMPLAYSERTFHDAKHKSDIQKGIRALEKAIDQLPPESKQALIGKDPLATSSLDRLSADLKAAKNSFDQGRTERARAHLQGAIDHCFRCHSRSATGPEYTNIENTINKLPLALSEQADLYVATRQYDKATKTLAQKLAQSAKPYEKHHDLVRALKKYLAIVVRIKKQPNLGIEIIENFQQQHHIPLYLKGDLAQWTQSLKKWAKEADTEKPTLAKAFQLIEQGNALEASEGFQRGYIEYLRGSSMLHALLSQSKTSAQEDAKIYLALGNSYEAITALGLWELPEIYYKACIKTYPKSKPARQCYTHLEHTILLGYTGSAGTQIPEETVAELQKLCRQAGIETDCYQE